jgi:arylsulfatase A-like enzyme
MITSNIFKINKFGTMNLIFITIDGARADRIIKGKGFQKLISKSAFFPKVITYAPYTIGAMHAIFSGTYGNKTGVNSYWSNLKFKKDLYKTLPKYLHDHGYVTHADVINKLVLPPEGFDEFIIHDELNDNLTERHLSLLDKFNIVRKEGKNFFLYLHYSSIHTGIMEQVLKKYDNFSDEYFSNREKNEIFYDKLFTEADEYLDTIISHCEDLEFLKDTLIVIISDHGISVGDKLGERAYGVFCYDYTLVSNTIFYHKNVNPISVSDQVRSIDILPTILEILSVPIDPKYDSMQGESLVPFLDGNGVSKVAFSQSGNPLNTGQPPKEPNVWSVRTNEWKFIRNLHDQSEELYSLNDDPKEDNNVINIFPEIAVKLRKELEHQAANT